WLTVPGALGSAPCLMNANTCSGPESRMASANEPLVSSTVLGVKARTIEAADSQTAPTMAGRARSDAISRTSVHSNHRGDRRWVRGRLRRVRTDSLRRHRIQKPDVIRLAREFGAPRLQVRDPLPAVLPGSESHMFDGADLAQLPRA